MGRFMAGFFISMVCGTAALAILNALDIPATDATGWLLIIVIGIALRYAVEKLVIYRAETED